MDKLWESSEEESRSVKKWKSLVQTIWASTTRFKDDEDIMRASSIAFQVVVSAIPLLVVGLFVLDFIVDIKAYEALAKEYVRKNDITLDISVYFNIFYGLLDNKGAISGIGILFVVYSATSILKNLEEALNRIWGVKKPRPFFIRVAFFVSVIILAPFLIGIGLRTGQNLINEFSSPNLKSIRFFEDTAIVTGDKHVLMERERSGNWKYRNIMDRIDFEFQKSPIVFDGSLNKILLGEELLPYEERVRYATKNSLSTADFQDVEHMDEKYWILTDEGSILYSMDNGETWRVRHFQRVEGRVLVPARFSKIRMWDEQNGNIIGDRGLILGTNDGGETWNPLFVPDFGEDLNAIAKIGDRKILVVGQHFSSVISQDGGKSWSQFENINQAKSTLSRENLNGISLKGSSIYICGDIGTIIYSKDAGATWIRKDIGMKNIDFHDLLFLDENRGLVVGDDGNIRYTEDGGIHWSKADSGTSADLWGVAFDREENKIFIAGSNYRLLSNQSGTEDISKFQVIKKSPLWRKTLTFVGNFLIPFLIIWLVFLLLYKTLPNTNVEFKAAGIGATITAFIWVAFLLFFKYYAIISLNKNIAIYGALAAIPLFLLLVNLSVMITLYGAEISYLVQNPAMKYLTYKQRVLERIEHHQIWWGISILRKVFENFHNGKGETKAGELLKICHHDENEFIKIVEIFEKNAWIGKWGEKGWTPIVSADNIKILDVVASISPTGYDIEDYSEKDEFKKRLGLLFSELEKNREKIIGDLRLDELLDKGNR